MLIKLLLGGKKISKYMFYFILVSHLVSFQLTTIKH